MASAIDVNQLIADIKNAASTIIGKDVTMVEGFSQTQATAMATQAAWIASGTLSGQLTPDLRDYFLKNLEDLAKNFANVLKGLLVITIEKVWNAVVGVLWDTIGKAIGVGRDHNLNPAARALALTAFAFALAGCASGGATQANLPRVGEFDVPRALTDVYVSEVTMLRACRVGPVSRIFDLAIDPSIDSAHGTASIAITGTGMFDPHDWGRIDLEARGAQLTHVRVFAERHGGLETLSRDAERWGNAMSGC
jgi:hypothetical protein